MRRFSFLPAALLSAAVVADLASTETYNILAGRSSVAFIPSPRRSVASVRSDLHPFWARPRYLSASCNNKYATPLFAKKKAAPASKKIQVKMLKTVPGTGQKGEIIMVAPAFYQNKLRPTKAAELISEEQVQELASAAAAAEAEASRQANKLKDEMQSKSWTIKRKAGPEGSLFGSVAPKGILMELGKRLGQEDFFDGKNVKVREVVDGDGKKVRGDIKHTGNYTATVSLAKDVKAKVEVCVTSE